MLLALFPLQVICRNRVERLLPLLLFLLGIILALLCMLGGLQDFLLAYMKQMGLQVPLAEYIDPIEYFGRKLQTRTYLYHVELFVVANQCLFISQK